MFFKFCSFGLRETWFGGLKETKKEKGERFICLIELEKALQPVKASTGALEANWYQIWYTAAASLGTGLALVSLVRM